MLDLNLEFFIEVLISIRSWVIGSSCISGFIQFFHTKNYGPRKTHKSSFLNSYPPKFEFLFQSKPGVDLGFSRGERIFKNFSQTLTTFFFLGRPK